MIVKNEIPILEYDNAQSAVINPWRKPGKLPRLGLMIFFEEVLNKFVEEYDAKIGLVFESEMKHFPVYVWDMDGVEVCAMHAMVGAPGAALQSDWLYAKGVEFILACGGCGVLEKIASGHVLVPTKALRDEGTSYKYLPASRWIELEARDIATLRGALDEWGVDYIACPTWTTDGFYRETAEMTAYRREEGCLTVEMECATIASVAKFRGKRFVQLLYSGDSLADPTHYDDRKWRDCASAREKLARLALAALVRF